MSNMPEEHSEQIACTYCGKNYTANLTHCPACGTPVPDYRPPEEGKSMVVAVLLAFFFGPLGLLYSNIFAAIVLMVMAAPLVLAHQFTVFTKALFCFASTAVAIYSVKMSNGEYNKDSMEAQKLLNAAAKLERTDINEAVVKYREIVATYPGTAEADEATRNIETLIRPKLPES